MPEHKTNTQKTIETLPVEPNRSRGYQFVKRSFDIFASIVGLIILSPIFLIISAAIFIDDPGPVLFLQDRNGLDGKVFKMFKFRSMYKGAPEKRFELEKYNNLDGPAFKMKNDPRVTRVGKVIRKTSIDELPQLINILLGQMSFVGPRPLPTYETALLNEQQQKRMLVKPGLICYWQVCGRNDIAFDEWMKMDYRYINEANILTDLKLLCMAVPAVLSGKGAD